MITCKELAEFLIDYVSGELPPAEQARFEQHLHCCPPCVSYVETYRLTIQISRCLPCRPMPPEVSQRLQDAMESVRRQQPPSCGG